MTRTIHRVAAAVVFGAFALSACSAGGTVEGTDRTTTTGGSPTTGSTEPPEETTTTDGGGTPRPTEPPEETTTTKVRAGIIEVTEAGFSTYLDYDDSTRATAGAVLVNNSGSDASFVEVIFTFLDASGKPVATETTYVEAIEANGVGHAGVEMVELHGEPTEIEVAVVADEDFTLVGTVIPITVEGVEPSSWGDGVTVRGIATNDGSDPIEMASVACVLRSGGEIVGSAWGYLDTIVPGSSILWDADGSVPANDAECSASFTDF